jgi:hypothetical protein
MYKLMTLAVVLVALALAPVLGGVSGNGTSHGQLDPSQQLSAPRTVDPGQALTCDWACQACESDQGCRQICTEIGDCGSTCGVMASCDAQHAWSDEACACVSH